MTGISNVSFQTLELKVLTISNVIIFFYCGSPDKTMKVKFPPCFKSKKQVWKDRISCKTCFFLSSKPESCWGPFFCRAPSLLELQCKLSLSFHKYYQIVIQKMWNHSWPSLPIIAYCLHPMALIEVLSVPSDKWKERRELHLVIFSLWSKMRFSFAEGRLWR